VREDGVLLGYLLGTERVDQSSQASARTVLARSVASRGRRSTAGRRPSARPKVGGPERPTDVESRTLRPLDTQLRT
jgi:hypothetical protein